MTMTSSQPDDPVPHSYVILAHVQRCTRCCAVHRWSETYASLSLSTTWSLGKRILNLHRIDQPKYDLPITIRHQPEQQIPFCHACNEPTLHDLPPPPPPPKQLLSGISAPIPLRPAPRPAAKRPTLADLTELLK